MISLGTYLPADDIIFNWVLNSCIYSLVFRPSGYGWNTGGYVNPIKVKELMSENISKQMHRPSLFYTSPFVTIHQQVEGMMSINTRHSLNQRSSIKNHDGVEEQARQEEVHTGTKNPRQLQKATGNGGYRKGIFAVQHF